MNVRPSLADQRSLDPPRRVLLPLMDAPLRSLRLTGPQRSLFRRTLLAVFIFLVAGWSVGWQAYGWYHWLAGNRSLSGDHCHEALAHYQAALSAWPSDAPTELAAARAARRAGD